MFGRGFVVLYCEIVKLLRNRGNSANGLESSVVCNGSLSEEMRCDLPVVENEVAVGEGVKKRWENPKN